MGSAWRGHHQQRELVHLGHSCVYLEWRRAWAVRLVGQRTRECSQTDAWKTRSSQTWNQAGRSRHKKEWGAEREERTENRTENRTESRTESRRESRAREEEAPKRERFREWELRKQLLGCAWKPHRIRRTNADGRSSFGQHHTRTMDNQLSLSEWKLCLWKCSSRLSRSVRGENECSSLVHHQYGSGCGWPLLREDKRQWVLLQRDMA